MLSSRKCKEYSGGKRLCITLQYLDRYICFLSLVSFNASRTLHFHNFFFVRYCPLSATFGQPLQVTRIKLSAVHALLDHPFGVIVEYPQSGTHMGQAIAHRFPIDPLNFINLRKNMQYSLGAPERGHPDVQCALILQGSDLVSSKKKLLCFKFTTTCMPFNLISYFQLLRESF